MLRKLSQSLLALRVHSHEPADDGKMDFDDGPLYQQMYRYDPRTVEALALESVIAPTLTAMNTRTLYKENLMQPRMRPGQSVAQSVQDALSRRPSALATEAMGQYDFLLLQKPVPPTPMLERENPFEDDALQPVITPMPKRPVLHHRPVSYRVRRDVPLRVQTLRRNHQEAYIRSVLERVSIEMDELLEEGLGGGIGHEAHEPQEGSPNWHNYTMVSPKEGHITPPEEHTDPKETKAVQIYYDRQGRGFI